MTRQSHQCYSLKKRKVKKFHTEKNCQFDLSKLLLGTSMKKMSRLRFAWKKILFFLYLSQGIHKYFNLDLVLFFVINGLLQNVLALKKNQASFEKVEYENLFNFLRFELGLFSLRHVAKCGTQIQIELKM